MTPRSPEFDVSHPNEVLIQRLFAAFRDGDRSAAVAFFAEDAVFRYPGTGPLQDEYRGHEGVLHLWAEQDRVWGGASAPELIDLVVGDRNAFLLVRIAPTDGRDSWLRVVVYEIVGGAIAGARVFEDDPRAAEAFFSSSGGRA